MKTLFRYIFLIIFLLTLLTRSVSKEEKESITRQELEELLKLKEFQEIQEDEDSINLKALFSGNECLPSKSDTSKILKDIYGISESNPDDNLRFIVGKCNPIILVPGLYFTKLLVQVNCKGLYTYEKETTFRDLRVSCGDTVCQDETKEYEEHSLFISLTDNALSVLGIGKDKYSTCLAFFMNFFQNEKECPSLNGKPLCYYSKYVQVGF